MNLLAFTLIGLVGPALSVTSGYILAATRATALNERQRATNFTSLAEEARPTPWVVTQRVRRVVRRLGHSMGMSIKIRRATNGGAETNGKSLKLLIATGNLGGGKPQPEFQGGDWEDEFGEFEVILGAMILATAEGCPANAGAWGEKFKRYEKNEGGKIKGFTGWTCNKEDKTIQFSDASPTFSLPQTAEDILGNKAALTEALSAVSGNLHVWADALYGEPPTTMETIFKAELVKSARFSGPEACLKNRRSYPYFEKGFMELVGWYREDKDKFLIKYLQDLRGTAADLKALAGSADAKPEVARENDEVSMCKGDKKKGGRAKLFAAEGKVDWLSMAVWDVYVLQAFVQWAAGPKKPLESMTKKQEKETIEHIAKHFMGAADLFFVQESGKNICENTGLLPGAVWKHCEAMMGSDGTYDAALFLRKKTHHGQHPQTLVRVSEKWCPWETATDAVRHKYKHLLHHVGTATVETVDDKKKVVVKRINTEALGHILQEKNRDKAICDWDEKAGACKEQASVLGKVELAVAHLGEAKVPVLLVSAHPDSSGMFCAFQLYLAKEVFEAERARFKLQYLIVGMDVNLMTDDDFVAKRDDKKNPGTNGFDEGTFKPGKVDELGFDVLWPKHATVNKQRTFLQTQLSKAAKHDMVKKDMVFIYPKGKIVGEIPEADVYNKLNPVPDHDPVSKYPRLAWPMDHCVSMAAVTLEVR